MSSLSPYIGSMDIAQLSTALSQMDLIQSAGMQVQKMAMDSAENQGAAVVGMMQESFTDPALGQKIDLQA